MQLKIQNGAVDLSGERILSSVNFEVNDSSRIAVVGRNGCGKTTLLKLISGEYDIVFIDAAKSKYSIFLEEGIRLIRNGGLILADNVLYKGYVMSDYNKHKQRTAVRHLREYIKDATEDQRLETKILEVGDGLAISVVK